MSVSASFDFTSVSQKIDQAVEDKKLIQSAADNIKIWLQDERYTGYAQEVADLVQAEKWQDLDDVFWTIIPFGTGGRRGKMFPVGCNAINDRTIGESAQGLANYIKQVKPEGPWSCGIAYDTRHKSRHFAELCAGILAAAGFKIFFIDDYRSTPELSYLVRLKKCDCGIMVTASHNPPSDNAVKVYWSTGGQLVPPHDKGVIDEVMKVQQIEKMPFSEALSQGRVELCKDEVDQSLLDQHMNFVYPGPKDLKVIYSPLHGVGEFNVRTLLEKAGFHSLEIYEPHRQPSGDFPNVPGNVSNPENPDVFTRIIEDAKKTGGELALATDPDCDRMGAAAPVTTDPTGPWDTLTGNQLGALLADFVLEKMKNSGTLNSDHFIVSTLVTSLLKNHVANSYGIKCYHENLVGFKWICHVVDQVGAENFVFGSEESYGYLAGTYARDKDGAIACLLISQLAAQCKADGISLFDRLEGLYRKHGFHSEHTISIFMHGSDGMRKMKSLMSQMRNGPPKALAGKDIWRFRDYGTSQLTIAGQDAEKLDGPVGDLVIFDFDEHGTRIAIRPSGTEPKVKFYMFFYQKWENAENLSLHQQQAREYFEVAEKELRATADSL